MAVHGQPPLDSEILPSDGLRKQFRRWRGASLEDIDSASDIIDPRRHDGNAASLTQKRMPVEAESINEAFRDFASSPSCEPTLRTHYECFEVKNLSGLFVFPDLFPAFIQMALLDKILHRDLSDPLHQTNLHLFHQVVYPRSGEAGVGTSSGSRHSFFAADPATLLQPKDPTVHKPVTIAQMLQRKLRWVTLGGQYDWSAKVYPEEEPPLFPEDVARLLKSIFPNVDAQAAIVNFYTPGDNLSIHRDVSEDCDHGLISISIGCDAIFLVGTDDSAQSTVLRLRSGDAVLMSGSSRFAFHAVPKVLANTCPTEIESWPFNQDDSQYQHWRDWLKTKRINLNVRQMKG